MVILSPVYRAPARGAPTFHVGPLGGKCRGDPRGRPAWGRPTLVVLDQRGGRPVCGRPALVAPDRRGSRPALVVLDQRGDCPACGRPTLVVLDRRGGRLVIMAPDRWLPSINDT
jgi:hypothetical protein